MEIQTRRQRMMQNADQENVNAIKGKAAVPMPTKRQGLTRRGPLGELNTNVHSHQENIIGKVAVTAEEGEKKASVSRGIIRSNSYSHVQSKVDTGRTCKNVGPSASKPSLRREESTAGLAAKAVIHTQSILKDTTNKLIQIKEIKKTTRESKRVVKLPTLKENKEAKQLKPILKEQTESLGKLKLAETTAFSKKNTTIINYNSLEKHSVLQSVLSPELPNDIEDIDAKDMMSPFLASIYIKDIYRYLTDLEEKYPIEEDYLKKQSMITDVMRATLIDWLVEVQNQFDLILETFQLTVGIIDRYLQIKPHVRRNQLQLIGVAAMFIASKYEEIYPPMLDDFVAVTADACKKSDILQFEREIMTKLGFCFARPIPLSFLRRFVKVANGTAKIHHLAKYFVDLCLVEYTMVHYRPSQLAAAAICLSIHLLTNKKLEEVWTRTLAFYSQYSLEDIDPVIRKIAKIVIHVEDSRCKAVYNKYLGTKFAKVASLPQLKGECIYELAKMSATYS